MIRTRVRKMGWVVSWFLVCGGLVITTFGVSKVWSPDSEEKEESASVDENSDLSDVFEAMSPEEKIGQLIAAPVSGVRTETASNAAELKAGFVGLFETEKLNFEQIKLLNEQIKSEFNSLNVSEPMIFADEEGGKVQRLRGAIGERPSLEQICAIKGDNVQTTNDQIAQAAINIRKELQELGVDGVWGPVADRTNPKSSVMATRTCSTDPVEIKEKVGVYVDAMESGGVMTVVKHYPGLGGTSVDPHFTEGSVENVDWEVFEPLVKMASGVMTTHVSVGSDVLPCTLSSKCLALLNELRLSGDEDFLVFSDDMGMDSVEDNYSDLEAAYLAVMAGVDVLVYGKGFEYERLGEIRDGLIESYNNDPYFRGRVDESVIRILRNKEK